jgi:resuscitation-promoting factor RpfB
MLLIRTVLLCLFVACMVALSLVQDEALAASQTCEASFYGEGDGFAYQTTASGEIFYPYAQTAAHPWLPFGTWVYVENYWTGYGEWFRITDRGPAAWTGRCIDLSAAGKDVVFDGVSLITVYY